MVDTAFGSSKRADCPRDTEEEGEVVGEPENEDCEDVESYKCKSPSSNLHNQYSV